MKKVCLIFGTRPEAIKMCPLVKELKGRLGIECTVCVTGQHREMLDRVLDTFGVIPDLDLNIMRECCGLSDISRKVLEGLSNFFDVYSPDIALVHGDTTTAFAASLACFYRRIPIGHVEAGLRTDRIFEPYPEEFNRRAISLISDVDFAPTSTAAERLLREGKRAERIFVTGNTAIDALRHTVRNDYFHPLLEWVGKNRLILLTVHRRESIGEPMRQIFRAVRSVSEKYEDVRIIYPVHMNPAVREIAENELGRCARIKLTDPFDVIDMHNIMARSYIVVTDSGGLQEEAPYFDVPVIVARERTERSEGLLAGTLKLSGTNEEGLKRDIELLLENGDVYSKMASAKNPYGNGYASRRIADVVCSTLFPYR